MLNTILGTCIYRQTLRPTNNHFSHYIAVCDESVAAFKHTISSNLGE